MKIAIDYSPVLQSPAGIGQYVVNLVSKLIENHPENEYIIYSTKSVLVNTLAKNIVIKQYKGPASGVIWLMKVARDAKQQNVDLLLSPSNFLLASLFNKTIQIVYDLAPIKSPKSVTKKFAILYKITLKLALKNAWQIITISKTVKDELEEFCPNHKSNISVITPAINKWFHNDPKNKEEVISKYQLPSKYLLALSTMQPRKNFVHILKGFFRYKEQYDTDLKLVIVGQRGWKVKEINETIETSKYKNDVHFLGYVPNNELSAIYSSSAMFINLSYYEGFGMPALESLYFKLPTLISDIPVYRELFDNHAKFVGPEDIDETAKSIDELSKSDRIDHADLVNNYTWDKSANILNDIINGRS